MSETPLTASAANGLSGTTDSETDFVYPTIGESPYYTTMFRSLARLLTLTRGPGNALRVYKDGDLTFGVRAGRFMDGATARDYAGAAAQALTNNATNYIYLTAAGTLSVNTSGFPPAGTTPHVPLAAIVTSGGTYDHDDTTDYRGRAVFQCASVMTPANANTLVGGANADALHVHAAAGLADGAVTVAKAADAVQDLLPNLGITAGQESGDKRTVTIQARDAAYNNLAQRFRVRVWIATSDFGPPSATGNTVAVSTGTQLRELTANADYEIIGDAGGAAAIDLTISGAASRYILAEVDGRIHSSGEVTWEA